MSLGARTGRVVIMRADGAEGNRAGGIRFGKTVEFSNLRCTLEENCANPQRCVEGTAFQAAEKLRLRLFLAP